MPLASSLLEKIDAQKEEMVQRVKSWAEINSGPGNAAGQLALLEALKEAFLPLGAEMRQEKLSPRKRIDRWGQTEEIPLGNALILTKRPQAPFKLFLGGHLDTVYSLQSPFQKTERVNEKILKGPGVADMKGGLAILLKTLECIEESPYAEKIGWEVLINPDEESGSASSAPLFAEAAKRNHVGLLFEPAFPDGAFVGSRKGSANFTAVMRGKSAHAGRNFFEGRNAIVALARFITGVSSFTNSYRGTTVNVGLVEGGEFDNVVPAVALCRFNARMDKTSDLQWLKEGIAEMAQGSVSPDGISVELYEHSERPPKPFDSKTEKLFSLLKDCGKELGLEISWRPSGGVCDGNLLAAQGLPVIDALGVVGGEIHTEEEFLLVDSLAERTKLAVSLAFKLASQEKNWEFIEEKSHGSALP